MLLFKMKKAHFSASLFENMLYHIPINVAYPGVKDDDVCVKFDSLFAQSNE